MRYFFHRIDGGYDRDQDGTECADPQAARLEAALYAAGTLRDHPELLWADEGFRIEVCDENGLFVAAISIQASHRRRNWASDVP